MSSTFASSRLVRLLGDGAPAPAPEGFAERLAGWVNAFAAIELQATHQALPRAAAPLQRRSARTNAPALAQDVERARSALVRSIAADPNPLQEPGYAPWQRRHLELQRQMEQMTGALREHLRQSLSRSPSTRLRQLALLDAGLEKVTAPREQALAPRIVALLEQRFRSTGGDGFEAWWREALLAELELRLEAVNGLAEAAAEETDTMP